jgi:hypothetical protein
MSLILARYLLLTAEACKGQSFPPVKSDGSMYFVKFDIDAPRLSFTDADVDRLAEALRCCKS